MANDIANATGAQGDLSRALAFVRSAFAKWRDQDMIHAEQMADLEAYYQRLQGDLAAGAPPDAVTLPSPDVCWSCKGPVGAENYCADCGAPARTEAVDYHRWLVCLCHEIKKHERENRLDLAAAHGCLADANSRIAALRRKLNGQRIPSVVSVAAAPARPADPLDRGAADPRAPGDARSESPTIPPPRRSLLEMLLDPRSIQWLLGAGGAVLVIGLVLALWASGILENKLVAAVLLGAGNAVVLAGGLGAVRFTRYQTAGRALTFLACLVMPLNLWFYDYQDLITFREGNHLWLAALVCVLLYALSAALVRDPALVYVIVGGAALTGLLLLADHDVNHFWEASGPALFLTLLGLGCIHAERAFPAGDGPFTRGRFGLAFFWAGHAALAAGLLVVAAAQLTGGLLYHPFYEPVYRSLGFQRQPEIVTDAGGRLLAFCLVAAACYCYAYSDLVVRKVGAYVHLAVGMFLWAELLLLNMVFATWPDLRQWETVIVALALTGLLANAALTLFVPPGWGLRRTIPAVVLTLSLLPLLLGTFLHVRMVAGPPQPPWHYSIGWYFVVAMAVSAVACRASAYLQHGAYGPWLTRWLGRRGAAESPARERWLTTIYLFGGGGSLLLMASGILLSYDPDLPWVWVAPVLMLIPLAYLTAARLYRGRSLETPVVWAAHAMSLVLVVTGLGLALENGPLFPVHDQPANLLLACLFGEAAVFYLLAAVWRDREFAVYACAAAASAAVWQLLTAYDLPSEYYIGAFALLGVALLVIYRFVALERRPTAGLGRAAFQSANAFLSVAAVAGALRSASALLMGSIAPGLDRVVALEILMAGAGLAGMVLVRHPGWRRWYALAAAGSAVLAILVLVLHLRWTWEQKLELACLVLGSAVLLLSHVGWFREREREDDMVSFGLLLGCLLTAVPLAWALVWCRFGLPPAAQWNTFHTLNEVGALAAGLVLFGGGGVTRIKSTTLTGAALLAVYLLSLVAFLRIQNSMWLVGIYLTIGGGVFFGAGLLLAVYRDRLLALPQRVKRREGVFRVLNWR